MNINKLINKENLDGVATSKNITIELVSKISFKDYEIINIKVTNKNPFTVQIADSQEIGNIYLIDNKEYTYDWYNHEYIDFDITIQDGMEKNISIKCEKEYNSNFVTKQIVFDKIMLNNKNQDIITLKIDM